MNLTYASKFPRQREFYEDALKGAVGATEIEVWLLPKRIVRLATAEAERNETLELRLIPNARTVRLNETVFDTYAESSFRYRS